jgi:hypothetical protein
MLLFKKLPWLCKIFVKFVISPYLSYFLTMKIAILLSGGVDSSVSLRLLKKQGHDITAFYLKIWIEDLDSELFLQENLINAAIAGLLI